MMANKTVLAALAALAVSFTCAADEEHTTTGGAVAERVAAAEGPQQLLLSGAADDGFRGDLLRFTCKTDRPPLEYHAGDKMRFEFSVAFNQKVPPSRVFFVKWYRKGDDEICRSGFERIEEGRPVVVETSIDRPGFVNVDATLVDVDGNSFAYFPDGRARVGARWNGGAGADIDKLLPSAPEPEDFDAFWAKHLAALAKLPPNVKYKEVPDDLVPENFRGKRRVRIFSADCLGPRPCTASIAIPTDAKEKSLPIFASFDGYGEGPMGNPPDSWLYVDEPCVRVHVNAHGYELMREKAYYDAFFKANPNYAMGYDEYRNAETCYLYGMAMRAVRGLDVAKSQPEWDGKTIRLVGSSQGGAQVIWAASLAKGVTYARASVTWMCDVGSITAGRMRGMFPDYHPPMRYFDTVFHARRIPETCQVILQKAGIGDLTCPPAGQACLFNALNAPKTVTWIQNSAHLFTPHASVRESYEISRPAGTGVLKGDASALSRPRTVKPVKAAFDAKAWTIAGDGQEAKYFDFAPRTNLRVAGGTAKKKLPALSWVTVRGTLVAEADGEAVIGAGFDWWWECLVNGKRVFGRLPSNGSTAHSGCLATDWPFVAPVRKGANEVVFRVLLGGAGLASADALNGEVVVDDRPLASYLASLGKHETPGPLAPTFLRTDSGKASFRTSQPHPAGLAYRAKGTKAWKEAWDLRSATDHVVALPAGDWECELLEWRDDGQEWELLRRPAKELKQLALARLFGDHAVLQREKSVPVWGEGGVPGERLTLTVGGLTTWAKVRADGTYRFVLPPQKAGGPYELRVTAEDGRMAVSHDVMFGEVWVCSGQSNMAFTMRNAKPGWGDKDEPLVRSFSWTWTPATAKAAAGYSAVGGFFARELSHRLGVAVGILTRADGGTRIEAWTSRNGLMRTEAGRRDVARYEELSSDPSAWKKYVRWSEDMKKDAGPTPESLAWATPGFDDSAWPGAKLPCWFHELDLHRRHGAVWYRKTVDLPKAWKGRDLRLRIPGCDKHDRTFVNGTSVGGQGKDFEIEYYASVRNYTVPAAAVRDGRATVAIRVWSWAGGGGIGDADGDFSLTCPGLPGFVNLFDGEWKWKDELDRGPAGGGYAGILEGGSDYPGSLFEARIRPLLTYAIRGAVWYQGEDNAHNCDDYYDLLGGLVDDWRYQWGQGDFPFAAVQLAGFGEKFEFHRVSTWPVVREAIFRLSRDKKNFGVVSAMDVGCETDIHPVDKLTVGRRLAGWALHDVYGVADAVPTGPRVRSAVRAGAAVDVAFDDVAKGLKGEKGNAPKGFWLAGEDGEFRPAEAKITGTDTVRVSAKGVKAPTEVRYAWAKNPKFAELRNSADLPASSFRLPVKDAASLK